MRKLSAVTGALLLLAACGSASDSAGSAGSSIPAEPPFSEVPRPADATFECAEQTGGDDGMWHLVAVTEAAHEGFDRIVFEFGPVGDTIGGVPRYVVRPATAPFTEDPSGQPVEVHGPDALGVTLLNASGVDLSGTTPEIVYDGPKQFVTERTPVTSVVEAGDFENTMNWFVGLDAPRCFDVFTLDDPPRVVLDVEGDTG
jgi:hypothetical protein